MSDSDSFARSALLDSDHADADQDRDASTPNGNGRHRDDDDNDTGLGELAYQGEDGPAVATLDDHDTVDDADDADDAVSTLPALNDGEAADAAPGFRDRIRRFFSWSRGGSKPVRVEANDPNREATILQLRRGYSEAVDTMRGLRYYMQEHAERQEKIVELLQSLPDALQNSEAGRRHTETLDAIRHGLDRQQAEAAKLGRTLDGVARSTDRQEATHKSIRDNLDRDAATRDRLLHALDASREDADKTRQAFVETAESSRLSEDALRAELIQTRRLTIALLGVTAAAAVAGVIIAAIAVL